MSEITAATHPGSTSGVRATVPTRQCRVERCEMPVHIGIFFDGTGNSRRHTTPCTGH
jgi:hypothetical protein